MPNTSNINVDLTGLTTTVTLTFNNSSAAGPIRLMLYKDGSPTYSVNNVVYDTVAINVVENDRVEVTLQVAELKDLSTGSVAYTLHRLDSVNGSWILLNEGVIAITGVPVGPIASGYSAFPPMIATTDSIADVIDGFGLVIAKEGLYSYLDGKYKMVKGIKDFPNYCYLQEKTTSFELYFNLNGANILETLVFIPSEVQTSTSQEVLFQFEDNGIIFTADYHPAMNQLSFNHLENCKFYLDGTLATGTIDNVYPGWHHVIIALPMEDVTIAIVTNGVYCDSTGKPGLGLGHTRIMQGALTHDFATYLALNAGKRLAPIRQINDESQLAVTASYGRKYDVGHSYWVDELGSSYQIEASPVYYTPGEIDDFDFVTV